VKNYKLWKDFQVQPITFCPFPGLMGKKTIFTIPPCPQKHDLYLVNHHAFFWVNSHISCRGVVFLRANSEDFFKISLTTQPFLPSHSLLYRRTAMKRRRYNLNLSGKEPSIFLMALVDARDRKEIGYDETRSPKALEEYFVLRWLTKRVFHLIVGKSILPSMN